MLHVHFTYKAPEFNILNNKNNHCRYQYSVLLNYTVHIPYTYTLYDTLSDIVLYH